MPLATGSFFSNTSSAESSDSIRNNTNGSRVRGDRGNGSINPGSLSRRENVVVTSTELSRMFDSLKNLGDIVKKQSRTIDKMAGDVERCVEEITYLRTEVVAIRECQENVSVTRKADSASYKGPIPKAVKDDVHMAHNQQGENRKFRGNEGIDSPHNTAVRAFLVQELIKEDNGHEKAVIMRAVTRYFETKRQHYLDSLPERREATEKKSKDKILTSRRRRLYVQRTKVSNEEEKERMVAIDHNYMSDEEDGEGEQKDLWVVRSPTWRSRELTILLSTLQERVTAQGNTSKHPKNKRIRGAPSTRLPPSNPPQWACQTTPAATRPVCQSVTADEQDTHARRGRHNYQRGREESPERNSSPEGTRDSSRSMSPVQSPTRSRSPYPQDREESPTRDRSPHMRDRSPHMRDRSQSPETHISPERCSTPIQSRSHATDTTNHASRETAATAQKKRNRPIRKQKNRR